MSFDRATPAAPLACANPIDLIVALFRAEGARATAAADALIANWTAEDVRDGDLMLALAELMLERPEIHSAGVEWLLAKYPLTNFGASVIDLSAYNRDGAKTLFRKMCGEYYSDESFERMVAPQ